MRPLTEEETKTLFTKLSHYIGNNIVHLVDRGDAPHVFRLHRDRVYYVSEVSRFLTLCRTAMGRLTLLSDATLQLAMRQAVSVARPNLISLGTCFGKFSKTGKFRLHITALDHLAQYAKYKVSRRFVDKTYPAARKMLMFSCLFLSFTGLDQAEWRAALPLRQPRRQGASGPHHGRHARARRRGDLEHVQRPSGLRCNRTIHNRYAKAGPDKHHRLPPG